MQKGFLTILFFLTINLLGFGQEKIELSAAAYHLITRARTLEFFTDQDVRTDFLKTLDSVTQKLFTRRLSYPDNFKFKTEGQDEYKLNPELPTIRKKDLNQIDKSTLYLSFDMCESPLASTMFFKERDTIFLSELARKKNICIYQFRAKMIRSDESVVMEKQLYVLLARPDNNYFVGFEHPFYNLSPSGFSKVLKSCLPILMDTSNETELIQITALPAYAPDNFIQPQLNNTIKIVTEIKKNFVQYNSKSGLQSFRFQEPAYELISLKGKKITPLPIQIQTAIRYQKRDYIFLWEEGRDVFANKNYKLQTIATVINDAYDKDRLPWVNLKTGLPLQFLSGNYHLLMCDTDTIARFSIQALVTDTSKKVYYDHVMNSNTTSALALGFLSTSLSSQTNNHVYHYVLNGTLLNKPFKVLISGINGTSSIKEIYFDKKLVCIAQGVLYPEIMAVMNPDFDPEIMNQLLLMSFSSLF
jgi:hypothetical protein